MSDRTDFGPMPGLTGDIAMNNSVMALELQAADQ
jgi:hypothetical protein